MSVLVHTEALGEARWHLLSVAHCKEALLQKVEKSETNIHRTVDKLSHLVFIKTPECRHNYPHFLIDEDIETQRGEILLLRLVMPARS